MVLARQNIFQGMRPKIAPQLLGKYEAQNVVNCKLISGELRPWDQESLSETLTGRFYLRTMYLYKDSYWLHWDADVNVVEGAVADDSTYKFYFTGDGIPKKSNDDQAIGSGVYPSNFYPMAAPQPRVALSSSTPGLGSGNEEERSYLWTIVMRMHGDLLQEESPVSPESTILTCLDDDTIRLTGMSIIWEASTAYDVEDWMVPCDLYWVENVGDAGTSGSSEPTFDNTSGNTTTDNGVTWTCLKREDLVVQRNTPYTVGEWIIPTGREDYILECTTNGTTHTTTEPDWDFTNGATTTDGTAVFTTRLRSNNIWSADTVYSQYDVVVPATQYIYKCVVAGTSGATEPVAGTTIDADTTDGAALTWRCYYKRLDGSDLLLYKRIYRTDTGNELSSWKKVADIDGNISFYGDAIEQTELGDSPPTLDYDPPPDGMTCLVGLPGGIFAGKVGNEVFFSKSFQPHLWSPYTQVLHHDVVSLGVVGKSVIAATKGNPYIVYGTTPSSMQTTKLPEPAPCVSKRSLVNIPGGVVYATGKGLYFVSDSEGQYITADYYTKDEWVDLYPATFNAAYHNGMYFGFYYDTGEDVEGALVFDLKEGNPTLLDFYPEAIFVDQQNDILYFIKSTPEVLLLENGTAYPSRANSVLLEDGTSKILLE